ncbi:MAG: (2Fe-2S)-binding protein [Burkholderia sp.]
MIVCVCKSVSDRKIRASLAEGVVSFDELQFELGVASCCGKCEESVRELITEHGICESHCGIASHTQAVLVVFCERKAA